MFPPNEEELEQIIAELEETADEAESKAEWQMIQLQIAERKKQLEDFLIGK